MQRQQSQNALSPEKMSGMVADLISKEMNKIINISMSGFMTNLESLITAKLRDSTVNLQGTNDGANNQLIHKFDQISSKLDNLVKARKEDFQGSENRLIGNLKIKIQLKQIKTPFCKTIFQVNSINEMNIFEITNSIAVGQPLTISHCIVRPVRPFLGIKQHAMIS